MLAFLNDISDSRCDSRSFDGYHLVDVYLPNKVLFDLYSLGLQDHLD